jgi:hypothetical protein
MGRRTLAHPEAFSVGNPQDFLALGAKVDITSAQKSSQLTESKGCDRSIAVGADWYDLIFFDKLDHFFLLTLYTYIF